MQRGVLRTEIPVLMLGMPAARLRSHSCRSPAYSVLSSGPASPVIPRSDAVVPFRIVRFVRVGVGASYTQKNSSLHPPTTLVKTNRVQSRAVISQEL